MGRFPKACGNSGDDVKLSFVSRGVGGVNENGVQLAVASNATILGFNVRPDQSVKQLKPKTSKSTIRNYLSTLRGRECHAGMLEPEFEEIVTGEAQVRQVFRISSVGPIAGCFVENGTISDGAKLSS